MDKAEKIDIGKIVLDEETNKKFLDFDNNRDIFYSGNKEDYYCKVYSYTRKLVYKSRNAGEMLLNKSFVLLINTMNFSFILFFIILIL